jgi:anti-anti-sigma factor
VCSSDSYTNYRLIIKPLKDVIGNHANEFRGEIMALIQSSPNEVDIDFSEVEFVDSIGLGVIISVHNSLYEKGGRLNVINIQSDIYELFKVMKFDCHFTIKKRQHARTSNTIDSEGEINEFPSPCQSYAEPSKNNV